MDPNAARIHANADTISYRTLLRTSDLLRQDLNHAVTRYDRAQARGRSYNPNALALYLARVDEVVDAYLRGATVQAAIDAAFSDRLLDRVLIALRDAGWPVAPRA